MKSDDVVGRWWRVDDAHNGRVIAMFPTEHQAKWYVRTVEEQSDGLCIGIIVEVECPTARLAVDKGKNDGK